MDLVNYFILKILKNIIWKYKDEIIAKIII